MMTISKTRLYIGKICTSAVCFALCMVLPMLTGAVPAIGKIIAPMHIPVLICGALCGPIWGGVVGILAPLLRGFMLGAPPLVPTGLSMMAELFGYGLFMGIFTSVLPKKIPYLYVSLVSAMLLGRVLGGVSKILLLAAGVLEKYSFAIFLSGYFTGSIPGIVVQLLLIPPILYALSRAKITGFAYRR